MNLNLKIAIGGGAGLVIGLAVGFLLGNSGKSSAEEAQKKLKEKVAETEATLKQEEQSCQRNQRLSRNSRRLMLSKEQLLRAIIELYANNYGLANQHLGRSRKHLKSLIKELEKGSSKQKVQKLSDKIGNAQTLAMRLDPMARVLIGQILREVDKLPTQ